jgi:hypothetical protein
MSGTAINKAYAAAATQWKRLRFWFYRRRDRVYRRLLNGKSGTLENGVRWWLDYPRPEQDKRRDRLLLSFGDPRAGGLVASGYLMKRFLTPEALEERFLDALAEHTRILTLRQLVPAEPGDPDGFFVKWGRC